MESHTVGFKPDLEHTPGYLAVTRTRALADSEPEDVLAGAMTATLLVSEQPSRTSPPRPLTRSDLSDVLDALRSLALAGQAMLIRQDGARGELKVVASGTGHVSASPDTFEHVHLPYDGEIRWIDCSAAGVRADGLLIGLSSRGDGASRSALLLSFPHGSEITAAALDRLVPAARTIIKTHLALKTRVQHAQRQRRAAMAVLQQNECGVIVLRSDRSVLLCNAAAESILATDAGLSLHGGTLRPTKYHDAVRFHTAIDCVMDKAGANPTARRSGVIMLLARPKLGRPLIAVITPASEPDSGEAAAIVYVLSPDQNIVRGIGPICAAHGLSPVETRLVTHLVGGSTISEAAADMRIKPATARSYLKQIFAKTNTHRQVDLVQLLTRYLRAVRGDFDFDAG